MTTRKREIQIPEEIGWADIESACIDLDIEPTPGVIASHPHFADILRRAYELALTRPGRRS